MHDTAMPCIAALRSDVDMHVLATVLPCCLWTIKRDREMLHCFGMYHARYGNCQQTATSCLCLPNIISTVPERNSLCSFCKQFVALLQAVSSRNKQPRLSVVKNLLKRLKPGCLRGSFVANDCTINPVLFSKGQSMTVRPLPVMTAHASNARRHQ